MAKFVCLASDGSFFVGRKHYMKKQSKPKPQPKAKEYCGICCIGHGPAGSLCERHGKVIRDVQA